MKDQAMVDDTTYGLMLWDGESKGTLNNVINMVRQKKQVVVLSRPEEGVSDSALGRRLDDIIDQL
jgi:hypothetical protein